MIMGPLPARPGPGSRNALTGSAAPQPGNRAESVTPTTTHSSSDRPHLPERDRPPVKRRLRGAWAQTSRSAAADRLGQLADELARSHPGASASLREGLEETITVQRLGITGKLKRTLDSTNPCESMIECVRRSSRNVKHWQNGDMALRWTAAGCSKPSVSFAV